MSTSVLKTELNLGLQSSTCDYCAMKLYGRAVGYTSDDHSTFSSAYHFLSRRCLLPDLSPAAGMGGA